MQLFYCPDISGEEIFTLPEPEMHHAVHVLRMKPGESLQLTDGKGKMFEAEIISAQKKECVVKILSTVTQKKPRNYSLHIAIAPTKSSDRFDIFLEKVTELGIDEITPLLCQNSERRKVNPEKELQTLISAMKQSGSAYLPKLNEIRGFEGFLKTQTGYVSQKFIAHCKGSAKKNFSNTMLPEKDILVLIGPEGDFTAEEILLAEKNNFTPVSLGEGRLRTETAGIAVCQTIHIINEIRK